eukprot:3424106-Pyramimonas_sp.AAC.2
MQPLLGGAPLGVPTQLEGIRKPPPPGAECHYYLRDITQSRTKHTKHTKHTDPPTPAVFVQSRRRPWSVKR